MTDRTTEFSVAVLLAHKHSLKNRDEIENSFKCGCFSCLRVFSPQDVCSWVDSACTAVCPYCNVDAVIGDVSGFLEDDSLLEQMNLFWFRKQSNE